MFPTKRYFSLVDKKSYSLELYEVSLIMLLLHKDYIKHIDTKPYGTNFAAKNMKEIYKHNLNYALYQNFKFNQLLELSGAIEGDTIILEKYDITVLSKYVWDDGDPTELGNELFPLLKKWD